MELCPSSIIALALISPSLASFSSFYKYKTCEIHKKLGTPLLGMTFRKNKSEAHLLFIFLAGLFCLLIHVLKMGPHGNFRIIWEFRCNWPKKTSRQIQRKNDNIHQKKQGEVQVPWSRQAQVHFRRQIGAWTFWTLWIFWIFSTFWQLSVFADSAQTEYCFTFHFRPSVCMSVTGVTSHFFIIFWWFRAWKPYIFWKHIIQADHPDHSYHLTAWPPDHLTT